MPCEQLSFVLAVEPVDVQRTSGPPRQSLLLVLLLEPLTQLNCPNAPATTNAHRGQLAATDELVHETAGDTEEFGRLLDSKEPRLSAPSCTVPGLGGFWHDFLAS